jgi:hypothetical protein
MIPAAVGLTGVAAAYFFAATGDCEAAAVPRSSL